MWLTIFFLILEGKYKHIVKQIKVAVVILNWNGKKYLEKFLPILYERTPLNIEESGIETEIIVADNASTDDSIEFLQKVYPNLQLIINSKNYGFAQGYNEALQQVEADYFVLLNSDVEVSDNWVEPIIRLMEEDTTIAAAQPKILSYDRRNEFEYAGGAGGYIDFLGYPFCRGRIFSVVEQDKGQYDDNCEIFWATGAAMFVRAGLYKKHGGLDNDFFAHMEEIDFCWRMKNYGYKIIYCADSVVYHIGGGTLNKTSPFKTYLNFRNNLSLLYKNLPTRRFVFVFFIRMFLDLAAALMLMLSSSVKDFLAVCKAYRDFFKISAKNRKKKILLVQHKILPQMYKGSIVLGYYLCRLRYFSKIKIKGNSKK